MRFLLYGIALCLLDGSFVPLHAQTNEELFRTYQFSFRPPGSRANGMGGAFIGAADDATAGYANPAGLAYLTDTAFSIEWTHHEREPVEGSIRGYFNTQYTSPALSLDTANFFSLNSNWNMWFFGVFRYRFLDVEQERSFLSLSGGLSGGVRVTEQRDVYLRLVGETQGFGIARRLGRWKLGLSLNYLDLSGQTQYTRDSNVFTPPLSFSDIHYQSEIDDQTRGWGFHLGLHREIGKKLSVGLVWRQNPVLRLNERVEEQVDSTTTLADEVEVPFAIPHVLGTGFQYRFRDDLRLLGDWQRIFYSGIIDRGFLIVESHETDSKDNYRLSDGDEAHLGLEWLIPTRNSVWAFRCGAFRDPQQTIQYSGQDLAVQDRFKASGLEDELRYTLGAGWSYTNDWELDAAASFWEGGKEFRVSAIWRIR